MKTFRYIRVLFVTMNMLCSLLFIVASFSDSVSPAKSMIFPYLGLFFPFFFIINCCFLIYWLIVRKWMLFFVVLCSFFVCWKPITHYIPFHPFPEDVTKKNTLKILTYNVMAFGYQDHTPEKPNPILQYIINSDADIVCMQEYFVGIQANYLTQKKIEQALNMYPYHYTIPLVRKNRYIIGLAIYSKYPILNSRKIRYDSTFNGSTIHEIDVQGKKLFVVNNHLESFKLTMEDRSKYTDFIKNMNADTFDELKETVQQKLDNAFLIRAEQAEIVAEEIQKLNEDDYLIVCGDLNDTPISYAYRVVNNSMTDAFSSSGNGLGITYNQHNFRFRIDHIFHSSNMKAYNATVDKVSASDHYPMWCYLEMN